MNSLRAHLIAVADAYCAGRGKKISFARVSTIIFNNSRTLDRVAQGEDLTTRNWERAMTWFHENWPEGAEWPRGTSRPGT